MGVILATVTTLLAFALAMLSRFSSKDHPKANRIFVILSAVNVLVGLGSLVSASRSVTQQNKILNELNEAQKKLLMKEEDQLRIGNELAGKLAKAQQTTEHISSELTNNTQEVGHVLQQTERALEPLGDLNFRCILRLPDTDEESANIVHFLEKGDRPIDTSSSDIEEKRRSLLRPRPIVGGLMLTPDAVLYPKPTTPLGALINAPQVLVQFYANHRPPLFYVRSKLPTPDLMTDITPTVQQAKWLMLTVPDHKLVLEFIGAVPRGKWASTGAILSVRDLLKAQAVIQPVFSVSSVTDEKQRQLALEKWAATSVHALVMYTGDGRRWEFDTKKVRVVHGEGAPLFVGQFKGPIKLNDVGL